MHFRILQWFSILLWARTLQQEACGLQNWPISTLCHKWGMHEQSACGHLSVFRSKSPSARLSLVRGRTRGLPLCTYAQICTGSLINTASLSLCHSTPWREASIDRQQSFNWSIVSFCASPFFCVHLSLSLSLSLRVPTSYQLCSCLWCWSWSTSDLGHTAWNHQSYAPSHLVVFPVIYMENWCALEAELKMGKL